MALNKILITLIKQGSVLLYCTKRVTVLQVLLVAAFAMPNQDLAFMVSVGYNILSSLLGGVWIRINEAVRLLGQPSL